MQLKEAIKKRKSVRRYSDKKPDWRKIIKAIDAARFAPSAGNQAMTKFILVQDENIIKELAQAAQQKFISQAKYVVVVVSDDSKLEKSYPDRGEKFARQQSAAAIENFLLALVEQGLVTCWIGYFDDNAVKRVLKIPDELTVEAYFPIGHETKVTEGNKQKPKPDLENVLYFDKWKNKYMKPLTRVQIEHA